ncbi:MAG: hypothetical protein ABI809_08095 [Caldimonas sp.]
MKLIVSLIALGLAGCGAIARVNGEDAQAIVDKRVVGTQVGDFVQRYGGSHARDEGPDGTVHFTWEGGLTRVAAGPRGLEEMICMLRISANKAGRIVAAPIVRDGKGERRLSRCAELFD